MDGRGIHAIGWRGEQVVDDSFYIIFNAYHGKLEYKLPPPRYGKEWRMILNTFDTNIGAKGKKYNAGDIITVEGLSVVLLIQPVVKEKD